MAAGLEQRRWNIGEIAVLTEAAEAA